MTLEIQNFRTYRRYKTDIENYRRISKYVNINFVLETRAIAQMKSILILIKKFIDTFVKMSVLPFFGPQRQKMTRKSRNWPYLKSRFRKKYVVTWYIILIITIICLVKVHQNYAKRENTVQNMLFLYTFSNFCISTWPRCARTQYRKRLFLQNSES